MDFPLSLHLLGIKTGNREKNREKEGMQGSSWSGAASSIIQLKYVDALFLGSILRL